MDDSGVSGQGLAQVYPEGASPAPPAQPVVTPVAPAAGSLDTKGPGAGTWIVGCLGLLLLFPGIVSLVLAGFSQAKSSAAEKMWAAGNAAGARQEASSAGALQIIAVLVSLLPLIVVFLAIFAVTFLGTTVEPAP